jgi:hypothetical protein
LIPCGYVELEVDVIDSLKLTPVGVLPGEVTAETAGPPP